MLRDTVVFGELIVIKLAERTGSHALRAADFVEPRAGRFSLSFSFSGQGRVSVARSSLSRSFPLSRDDERRRNRGRSSRTLSLSPSSPPLSARHGLTRSVDPEIKDKAQSFRGRLQWISLTVNVKLTNHNRIIDCDWIDSSRYPLQAVPYASSTVSDFKLQGLKIDQS